MKATTKVTSATPGFAKYNLTLPLLLVTSAGGVLYGVDAGIVAGVLPYFGTASGLTIAQISFFVAAALLGNTIASLVAGLLAEWMGRKKLMIVSGVLFNLSIPIIVQAHTYIPLVMGRLLQGISTGFISVVVPLFLAESLDASNRGKGMGIFQWLRNPGIVAAAAIAFYFSLRIEELGNAESILKFKDKAWRSLYWLSLVPGILFLVGSLRVAESPRWLVRHGREMAARQALLRSRSKEEAEVELKQIKRSLAQETAKTPSRPAGRTGESLLRKRYVVPFVLTCILLGFNQTTGVNSINRFNLTILIQAGLNDKWAHLSYLLLTCVNLVLTIAGVMMVDRKGRRFLLGLGSAGIFVSLICMASVFRQVEQQGVDCKHAIQFLMTEEKISEDFNQDVANWLLMRSGSAGQSFSNRPVTLVVTYSCGDFSTTWTGRSDESLERLEIARDSCLPSGKLAGLFSNPFASIEAARSAPLVIEKAMITPVPRDASGWWAVICLLGFRAFYSVGPAVCVWLVLTELLPTRIRPVGMSIALLINQAISTIIAAFFLPLVASYGYSTVFFVFAACTLAYFLTVVLFLPETKGKTLEEIEDYCDSKANQVDLPRAGRMRG